MSAECFINRNNTIWDCQQNYAFIYIQSLPSLHVYQSIYLFFSRYLRKHCDQLHITKKVQKNSIERWRDVVLHCANLQLNLISSVLCNKVCIHPINCTKMNGLLSVPVTKMIFIKDRQERTVRLQIPVACKCIKNSSAISARANCPSF